MFGMTSRRQVVRVAALSAMGGAVGLFVGGGNAGAQTVTVWLDVNGATAPPASGVTEGGTYIWEDAIWGTSSAGDVATGNYPTPNPGFPRFAAGSGANADATVSYTVTANADHLTAGMFLEDGAVGSTLTLNGTGVLSIDPGVGPQGFIVRGGSNLKILNKLSGAGGVSFQTSGGTGTGSLFLYGDNDYSGGTILATSGGLNINSSTSLGTGPISWTLSQAVLAAPDAIAPITLANDVNTRSTASTLIVTSPAVAPITFSGAWTLAPSVTTTLSIGNGTFPDAVTTISGNLFGFSSSITKAGTGTLVLTGNNSFEGGTTVNAGRLNAGSAGALASAPVTVAATGVLGVSSVDTAADLTQRPAVSSLTNSGLVDVASGGIRITSGVTESDLRTQLINGRNGGTWNGTTGITSSTAAASGGTRQVGYVMNSPTAATVAYASSGDTDLNHLVNTDDVLNILAAGKLDQNIDANWQEGDFNYDSRVNTDDILAILAEGNLDAGPYTRASGNVVNIVGVFPGNASLQYDSSNGNVKINTNGLNVSGFNLQDALADGTNLFAGSAAPTFPANQFSVTDTDTKVAWSTLTAPFSGLVDLGNIAVPGLSAADLLLQLSGLPGAADETYYTAQGIIGRQSFNVVPEPASLGLAALAGIGLLGRRRRRQS